MLKRKNCYKKTSKKLKKNDKVCYRILKKKLQMFFLEELQELRGKKGAETLRRISEWALAPSFVQHHFNWKPTMLA